MMQVLRPLSPSTDDLQITSTQQLFLFLFWRYTLLHNLLFDVVTPPSRLELRPIGDEDTYTVMESSLCSTVPYCYVYKHLSIALMRGEIGDESTLLVFGKGPLALALAYAGKMLGLSVQVHMIGDDQDKPKCLGALGAKVKVWPHGTNYLTIHCYLKAMEKHHSGWRLNDQDRHLMSEISKDYVFDVCERMSKLKKSPETLILKLSSTKLLSSLQHTMKDCFPNVQVLSSESTSMSIA